MSLSKSVQVGPLAITVAQAAGIVSLSGALAGSLGGGSAAGVAQGKLLGEIDVSAKQGADLALALLAVHFPDLSAEIAVVQAAVDAKLASS